MQEMLVTSVFSFPHNVLKDSFPMVVKSQYSADKNAKVDTT